MGHVSARSIAITGIGVVGAFGTTPEALWDVQAPEDAQFVPCSRFNNGLPAVEMGKIDLRQTLKSSQLARAPLVSQFAVLASHQAVTQARLPLSRGTKNSSVGIVFGTSSGPGAATQQIYDDLIDTGPAGVRPRVFQESVFNAPASLVSIHFGVSGPIQVLSAAGCTGAAVLYQAGLLLGRPGISAVIALCSEELCDAIQRGLRDLKWHAAYDEKGDVTPGAVMGEGAAALVLERAEDARARGVDILAELAGVGYANDAAALGRPAADGRGLVAAIETCLEEADCTQADVDMVLTGSAGTRVDDDLERAALQTVFGANTPPMGTTKRRTGFTTGAAPLFETVLAVEAVTRGCFPGSVVVPTAVSASVSSVLCNAVGLNGQFGAILVRKARS